MADTPPPAVQAAPPPNPVQENPHLENLNVPVAPGGDNELDDALNAVFGDKSKNETKQPEKAQENKAQPEKSEPKEDKKPEQAKQQGELPTPESLENDIPKNQKSWTALRNNYKQAASIIKQKDEELKKLKAGLAEKSTLSTKEIEDLKSQVQELSKYRTMIDVQADPEFISKYDQPISKIQDSIKEMLISLNVEKSIADSVDFNNTKLMDQIIGHVGENVDKITARKLERKIEEMIGLTEKRDETLSANKSSYKEFIEGKKKESSMKGAEEEGRILRQIEARAASQDESGNPNVPYLRTITPKEGALQPEIDQASRHNRMVELMRKKVHEAINLNTPEDKADLALAAVGSFWLKAQLNLEISRRKSVEEELKKISNVSSSSTQSKGKPGGPKNVADLDVDSALAQHFNR